MSAWCTRSRWQHWCQAVSSRPLFLRHQHQSHNGAEPHPAVCLSTASQAVQDAELFSPLPRPGSAVPGGPQAQRSRGSSQACLRQQRWCWLRGGQVLPSHCDLLQRVMKTTCLADRRRD